MEKHNNPFSSYRIPYYEDAEPIWEYETIQIYNSRTESISFLVAKCSDEKFAVGYNIRFENGREAALLPSLSYGYFKSRERAIMYMLGNCYAFAYCFSELAIKEIYRRISEDRQRTLF